MKRTMPRFLRDIAAFSAGGIFVLAIALATPHVELLLKTAPSVSPTAVSSWILQLNKDVLDDRPRYSLTVLPDIETTNSLATVGFLCFESGVLEAVIDFGVPLEDTQNQSVVVRLGNETKRREVWSRVGDRFVQKAGSDAVDLMNKIARVERAAFAVWANGREQVLATTTSGFEELAQRLAEACAPLGQNKSAQYPNVTK